MQFSSCTRDQSKHNFVGWLVVFCVFWSFFISLGGPASICPPCHSRQFLAETGSTFTGCFYFSLFSILKKFWQINIDISYITKQICNSIYKCNLKIIQVSQIMKHWLFNLYVFSLVKIAKKNTESHLLPTGPNIKLSARPVIAMFLRLMITDNKINRVFKELSFTHKEETCILHIPGLILHTADVTVLKVLILSIVCQFGNIYNKVFTILSIFISHHTVL